MSDSGALVLYFSLKFHLGFFCPIMDLYERGQSGRNIKPLFYQAVDEDLPVLAAIGYPRIVDLGVFFDKQFDNTHIQAADGVATVLFMYDPAFMKKFFDLSIPTIHFLRKVSAEYDNSQFIIDRKDNMVTIGWYTEMMLEDHIQQGKFCGGKLHKDYDTLVKFRVQTSGKWTPVCAQDPATGYELTYDLNMVELVGTKAAQHMLINKEWVEGPGFSISAKSIVASSTAGHKPIAEHVIRDKATKAYVAAAPVIKTTPEIEATPEEYPMNDYGAAIIQDPPTNNRGTKDHITKDEAKKAKKAKKETAKKAKKEKKEKAKAKKAEVKKDKTKKRSFFKLFTRAKKGAKADSMA